MSRIGIRTRINRETENVFALIGRVLHLVEREFTESGYSDSRLGRRLLGVRATDQSIAGLARRFFPYVWWPLPILLASGAILIIAEPARALENPVFLLKMGLLLPAVAVTLACQLPLKRDPAFWDISVGRKRAARLIAVASMPLWIAIICAGRWIAYVQGT
jgi:hypothetical protein